MTKSVSIITPTTGSKFLSECISSVRTQTYNNVEHIIVIDGYSRLSQTNSILKHLNFPNGKNEHICVLPYPTGIDRYNGHRIYGSATYFVNGDYHVWLDDDNVLEQNHIESLVNLSEKNSLDWAFSFRKIIDNNSNLICNDDCESLGMWPSILHQTDFFVDVNCYFVKKQIAIAISPVWYRKFREPGQVEIDRAIASILMNKENNLKYDCSRDYTVRYRVGNTGLSVQGQFFLEGNAKMLKNYNGRLPWKQ